VKGRTPGATLHQVHRRPVGAQVRSRKHVAYYHAPCKHHACVCMLAKKIPKVPSTDIFEDTTWHGIELTIATTEPATIRLLPSMMPSRMHTPLSEPLAAPCCCSVGMNRWQQHKLLLAHRCFAFPWLAHVQVAVTFCNSLAACIYFVRSALLSELSACRLAPSAAGPSSLMAPSK
jgi:hypothetical protein